MPDSGTRRLSGGVWAAGPRGGPRLILELIRDRPATLAADLAAELGMERMAFKRRVRQLKELGLTQSLERGYRLSPRGAAALEALADSSHPDP